MQPIGEEAEPMTSTSFREGAPGYADAG
ncbi:hypothetical protein TNCV_4401631, partial [Trichonephila clavipes]